MCVQLLNEKGQEAVNTLIDLLDLVNLLLNASLHFAQLRGWPVSYVLFTDNLADGFGNGRILLPKHVREDLLLDGDAERARNRT